MSSLEQCRGNIARERRRIFGFRFSRQLEIRLRS